MSRKKNKAPRAGDPVLPPLGPEEQEVRDWFRERLARGLETWDEESYRELEEKLKALPGAAWTLLEDLVARPSLPGVGLLFRLQELFPDKRWRKSVKKALFRIKQKGVSFDEKEFREGAPIFKEVEKKEPYGMVSPIDSQGTRVVLLVIPLRPRGWQVGGGLIGDEIGMRDFFLVQLSRSGLKELLKELVAQSPFPLVRTQARHSGTLFLECEELMEKRGQVPPKEYLDLRPWILENCPPLKRPIIYEFLDQQEIEQSTELLARSQSLLDMEPFNTWFLSKDTVQPYLEEIDRINQSQIVLAPAQKAERVKDIYRKAVAQIFTEEKRRVMRRRLEESAYLLLKQGKDYQARVALAAALDLSRSPSLLRDNDFLLALVTASLDLWSQGRQDEQQERDSRIIIP